MTLSARYQKLRPFQRTVFTVVLPPQVCAVGIGIGRDGVGASAWQGGDH